MIHKDAIKSERDFKRRRRRRGEYNSSHYSSNGRAKIQLRRYPTRQKKDVDQKCVFFCKTNQAEFNHYHEL